MEFKDRLRQARKKAGKTQMDMARAIGAKNYTSYGQYENGYRMPGFDMIVKFASTLDVSIDWLAGLSEDPQIHSRILPKETVKKAEKTADEKTEE